MKILINFQRKRNRDGPPEIKTTDQENTEWQTL